MRVFLIILGALSMLLGFGCAVSGFGTFRVVDSDGYISSGPGEVTTTASAIVAPTNEIEDRSDDPGFREGKIRVRIRAARSDGGEVSSALPAPRQSKRICAAAHTKWCAKSSSTRGVRGGHRARGTRAGSPAEAVDWVASASGRGEQELDWQVRSGSHAFVIMNADGSAGVTVEANLAVKLPYVRGLAWR